MYGLSGGSGGISGGNALQVVGAMVGHMSPAMVRYYTHISGNAARQAVEMLEKTRMAPGLWMFLWMNPRTSRQKLPNC